MTRERNAVLGSAVLWMLVLVSCIVLFFMPASMMPDFIMDYLIFGMILFTYMVSGFFVSIYMILKGLRKWYVMGEPVDHHIVESTITRRENNE